MYERKVILDMLLTTPVYLNGTSHITGCLFGGQEGHEKYGSGSVFPQWQEE